MHAMDIIDLQLKNGRWYMLVRDTNNVRNIIYNRNGNGELEKAVMKTSFSKKAEVRRLDGNMENAFYGTSWWELKDIFSQMDVYGNSPKTQAV